MVARSFLLGEQGDLLAIPNRFRVQSLRAERSFDNRDVHMLKRKAF